MYGHVYACRNCEREAISTPIVTAPMPAPIIPGSLASPSIVSHIMSQKYVEGMPLYRQEKYREIIDLSFEDRYKMRFKRSQPILDAFW